MGQVMDIHTHRCKSCGGQFMPVKIPSGYATVAGIILSIIGGIFTLSLVGIFIGIPLNVAAIGLFCVKKGAFKCQLCNRIFVP